MSLKAQTSVCTESTSGRLRSPGTGWGCGGVTHLRLLGAVGFEAADKERLAGRESLHEGLQRQTELSAQCWHLFTVVSLTLQRGRTGRNDSSEITPSHPEAAAHGRGGGQVKKIDVKTDIQHGVQNEAVKVYLTQLKVK